MTDPTADAIAALKLAAERIRISGDAYRDRGDDAGAESDLLAAAHLDEVRSALLSVQGQAGKPAMTSLLVKLASIAVHAEEGLGPHAHPFDLDAVRSLLTDPEIRAFLDDPKNMAFLPLKRNHTEKDDGHGRE